MTKVYNDWVKKYRGVMSDDSEYWWKLEWKPTFTSENDMKTLRNFYQNTWKCSNWDLDGILLSKVETVWA